MEEKFNNLNTEFETAAPQPTPSEQPKQSLSRNMMTVLIIVVSLLAGMAGGLYGALNLANRPGIQKLFNSAAQTNGNGQAINQNIVLNQESAITEIVKETSPAVVSIVISRDISTLYPFFGNGMNSGDNVQQVGAGTGFFVSADGLIVTNKHVVSDSRAQYTVVTNDGKQYDAKVVAQDPSNDLAIVKVDIANAPHLAFSDSSKLELGQYVIAIGNSLGQFQNTVTTGVVSGLSRSIVAGDRTAREQLEGVIQTDAAINPGNSGGPLLNVAGQIVGVNTAVSAQGQLIGFAIPSNDVKIALDSYLRSGKIVRPFLGVRYMILNEALAEQMNLDQKSGALLIRGDTTADFAVVPGSPADKAGLKEGDIILEVNGKAISEDNQLPAVLKDFKPGDTISVKVFSDGSEKTIPLRLGETN